MQIRYIFLLIFTCYVNYQCYGFTRAQRPLYPWFNSAQTGNLALMQRLVSTGQISVNAKDEMGQETALHFAARADQEEIVKFLSRLPGIDINAQNSQGHTALTVAAGNGHDKIVQFLLTIPGIELHDKYGSCPALISAAFQGREKILKLLLKTPGININAVNQNGINALFGAISWKKENSIKLLLSAPDINLNVKSPMTQTTALKMALVRQQFNIVALIEDKIVELISTTAEAIKNNNLTAVKSIIAQIGAEEIVDTKHHKLLDKVDKEGKTLLDRAFESNRPEIALYLLSLTDDPRELLARFPFEAVQPTSDLFKLCMELAYNNNPTARADQAHVGKAVKSKTNSCARCSQKDCKQRCAKCKKVYYCSSDCQKADWEAHKTNCG